MLHRCLRSVVFVLASSAAVAGEGPYQDDFDAKLGPGWSWLREQPSAWRIGPEGLELRLLPGNLWGRANDARNILLRAAPSAAAGAVEVAVTVSNRPTHQYEQANLAWYFNDSNMVKLGLELVDGQLCIVMGREQADKTRTLAKIPIEATTVRLRLRVVGTEIRGQYQPGATGAWLDAATGELPEVSGVEAKISLHGYQGPPEAEQWATFSHFEVVRKGG